MGNSLRFAMVDTLDYPTIQDVKFRTGKEVVAVVAGESAILAMLGHSQSEAIESQKTCEMLTNATPHRQNRVLRRS